VSGGMRGVGWLTDRRGSRALRDDRTRFKQEGMAGLADRSRRPHTSPTRLSADVEALICRLRREHPRWGARRISYGLGHHGLERVPSRATVHRVLTRNGF
jgi:Homeodomain-like domain